MQSQILDKYPDTPLRVYAVWFEMLSSDSRSRWQGSLMTDSRVVHYWDADKVVGRWFADQEDFRDMVFGPIAWDIFFLFGPESEWDAAPSPLVESGYTIVSRRRDLEKSIIPLLES